MDVVPGQVEPLLCAVKAQHLTAYLVERDRRRPSGARPRDPGGALGCGGQVLQHLRQVGPGSGLLLELGGQVLLGAAHDPIVPGPRGG